MHFKPIGLGLVVFVCALIIVVSLSQVAARSCTLAQGTNDVDRRFAVCIVRVP